MDKAAGLLLLAENAIRLPTGKPSPAGKPTEAERRRAEDERLAGILWNFVQTRRGNPPSGR